jgi:uncharacterized protein YegL
MRTRLSLLLALGLSLSGCYAVSNASDYYGIDTKVAGMNAVFLVDVSGSMEGKQEGTVADQVRGEAASRAGRTVERAIGGRVGRALGGQVRGEATKLGGAKRELIPVIRGLDASSRFTVLTFGDNTRLWRDELVEASAANKNLATAHVNGLDANGGTPILGAIERAFQVRGATTLFLMTDGEPTDASADRILERTRQLNASRRMVIHTVGLGADQNEDFLRTLAEQNGGTFVERR